MGGRFSVTPSLTEPVTASMDFPGIQHGQWKDSVFSCTSQIFPTCVVSFIFPFALGGHVAERIRRRRVRSFAGASPYVFLFIIALSFYLDVPLLLLSIWGWLAIIAYYTRTITREVFELPGDRYSDCFLSSLCIPCVIAQVVIALATTHH